MCPHSLSHAEQGVDSSSLALIKDAAPSRTKHSSTQHQGPQVSSILSFESQSLPHPLAYPSALVSPKTSAFSGSQEGPHKSAFSAVKKPSKSCVFSSQEQPQIGVTFSHRTATDWRYFSLQSNTIGSPLISLSWLRFPAQ